MPIYNTFAIHLPGNAYLVKSQGDGEEVDLNDAEDIHEARAHIEHFSDLKDGGVVYYFSFLTNSGNVREHVDLKPESFCHAYVEPENSRVLSC